MMMMMIYNYDNKYAYMQKESKSSDILLNKQLANNDQIPEMKEKKDQEKENCPKMKYKRKEKMMEYFL